MIKRMFFVFSCLFVFVASNTQAEYIWAMKVGVDYELLEWLDHTYSCIGSSSNCYACPPESNKTGGDPVVGGYGDPDEATCYAYCTLVYRTHGLCHQHTNRVLFAHGQTLNNSVVGYSVSSYIYGPWGTNFFDDCVPSCE
jgi:hypothetical protein